MSGPLGPLLGPSPPSRKVGLLTAILSVALCTAIVYPLKHVAPVVSLSVVYLPAVLVVSATWGGWLGGATAVLAALAFNFSQLPPTGYFTIRDADNWVALTAFLVVAWLVSSIAEATRQQSREAAQRRREADLAAEMARLLLRGNPLAVDLPVAAARLSEALGLPSASIALDAVESDERQIAFPLRDGTRRLGTLLVPVGTSEEGLRRLQERVAPSLEALLSAALEREALLEDVVETAALRRADVVKTALLRAVSHDLRSPLTAISTASEALRSNSISERERSELAGIIEQEAQRLSRLVDNLLDLSRLEAGVAHPHLTWTSVEETIKVALHELSAKPEEFSLAIDADLPLVRADPVQLERAFANVMENARRHSGGHPVSVRARAVRTLTAPPSSTEPRRTGGEQAEREGGAEARSVEGTGAAGTADAGDLPVAPELGAPQGDRLIVRIVDRGPGIPPAQLPRVFEPFYRTGTREGGHRGSGLGLAIARGFAEANGGRLRAESLPGQGASFVFELPLGGEGDREGGEGRR